MAGLGLHRSETIECLDALHARGAPWGGTMWLLLLPLKFRYILLTLSLLGFAGLAAWTAWAPDLIRWLAGPLGFFGFFSALGLRDYFQRRHAILRNYPIAAHLRFLFETI